MRYVPPTILGPVVNSGLGGGLQIRKWGFDSLLGLHLMWLTSTTGRCDCFRGNTVSVRIRGQLPIGHVVKWQYTAVLGTAASAWGFKSLRGHQRISGNDK